MTRTQNFKAVEASFLAGTCLDVKSLNVGCGSDPWGDVRVDVVFSFITVRFKPAILVEAHYLPFKR